MLCLVVLSLSLCKVREQEVSLTVSVSRSPGASYCHSSRISVFTCICHPQSIQIIVYCLIILYHQ